MTVIRQLPSAVNREIVGVAVNIHDKIGDVLAVVPFHVSSNQDERTRRLSYTSADRAIFDPSLLLLTLGEVCEHSSRIAAVSYAGSGVLGEAGDAYLLTRPILFP